MSCVISLTNKSESVASLCSADPDLATAINKIGELTYAPYVDSFHFLVDTIVGQMLSNKVADVISSRLALKCDGHISVDMLSKLSLMDFQSIGISKNKAKSIIGLADFIRQKPEYFGVLQYMSDGDVVKSLTSLYGIGTWTAKMYLIFVLNRQDVLPFEDGAFLQAYRWLYRTSNLSPAAIIERCNCWHPYASIASRYLYRILDMGYTKYPSVYDLDKEPVFQR